MRKRPLAKRQAQLDLFRSHPLLPTWREVSSEARRQCLPLLARLLLAHRQTPRIAGRGGEVQDE
jgi:hypothetical protein